MLNFKYLCVFIGGLFCASAVSAVEEGYPVYYDGYASDADCSSYNSQGVCIQPARNYQHQSANYTQSRQSQKSGYNDNRSQQNNYTQARQSQSGYSYNRSQQNNYKQAQSSQNVARVSKYEGAKKFSESKGKNQIELNAFFGRRFADFEYQLDFGYSYDSSDALSLRPYNVDLTKGPAITKSAGSILEWDDMIFNEITLEARKDFTYKKYPLFVFGEYRQGQLAKSGDSRDDDLTVDGLWDISIGGIDASLSGWKLGIGWDKAFAWSDFTFSPVFGYMSQSHDLTMTDQMYPQPDQTVYVYDGDGNPIYEDTGEVDEDGDTIFAHACVWNNDVDTTFATADGFWYYDSNDNGEIESGEEVYYSAGSWYYDSGLSNQITFEMDTDNASGNGVDGCLLGGYPMDVALGGATQIYNTNWKGFFLGIQMDRQFNARESLSFYGEISMLDMQASADWIYRDDLMHPSFSDSGTGMGYALKMEYTREFMPTWAFKFVVEMEEYEMSGGSSTTNYADGSSETISGAFNYMVWRSMGMRVGISKKF
ncbi:MAG: hypothetical protein ACTSXV_01405 [Alphaproteobacteria bacterium]